MSDLVEQSVGVVHEFISGSRPLDETLTSIAELATSALGTDMAGLSLNEQNGRARTVSYTDAMVPEMDQAQYDADRGPCLEAFRVQRVQRIDQAADDARWPEFARVATEHGIRAVVSLPVVVARSGVGALNFYDHRADHFDDSTIAIGKVFAGQTAIVAAYFDRADEADNLTRALESRATIEQAKGVIMATAGCDPDGAFAILRQQSQSENRKLRDLASEIVARQQTPVRVSATPATG